MINGGIRSPTSSMCAFLAKQTTIDLDFSVELSQKNMLV